MLRLISLLYLSLPQILSLNVFFWSNCICLCCKNIDKEYCYPSYIGNLNITSDNCLYNKCMEKYILDCPQDGKIGITQAFYTDSTGNFTTSTYQKFISINNEINYIINVVLSVILCVTIIILIIIYCIIYRKNINHNNYRNF